MYQEISWLQCSNKILVWWKFLKETEQGQEVASLDIYFKMKNEILYRYYKNVDGREISPVVVPKGLREKFWWWHIMQ